MSKLSNSLAAARGPRVGVVTVAFLSDDVLPQLLTSIKSASKEPVAVVVVDNDPSERSLARIQADEVGAAYIARPDNPGYGAGMNAGVALLPASVKWVVICNPDLKLEPGSIDALLSTATTDARIAAVGPTILNIDGSVYPSARLIPSLRTGVGHALFAKVWASNPWTKNYTQQRVDALERRDAGWLSGACLLVRRSAFVGINGFDEAYFMYFEDVDLGNRFGNTGWRNVFEPAASVVHIGGHSTAGSSARMVRAHHESARRFLDHYYSGWALWPLRFVFRIGLGSRSAILRRRLRRSSVI
jgi:N-acetylglucosaminyl-diphospho-decaprenol L-rhamnosyltransferase